MLFPKVQAYFDSLDTSSIPEERLSVLNMLRNYVSGKLWHSEPIDLTFICTHNSRRSHLGQVWAQVAAHEFNVPQVNCYSGGTEATACNPRTITALERAGLITVMATETDNPIYEIHFTDAEPPILAFSKLYGHRSNPDTNFAAIMTCSHAEQNCPYIPGAEQQIAIMYPDPKEADGTVNEAQIYDERCRQIATEMKYVFQGLTTLAS